MANKKAHLQFIYDRMRFIHGEDKTQDYMIYLQKIIDMTPPTEEVHL